MSRLLFALIGVLALAGAAVWLGMEERSARGAREVEAESGVESPEHAPARIEPAPATTEAKAELASEPAPIVPRREAKEPTPHEMPRAAAVDPTPAPLTITGRVLDDLDQPVSSFVIDSHRAGSQRSRTYGETPSQSYRDTDGSFELTGFAAGDWEISAMSREGVWSAPVQVTLPSEEPVELVVPRGAILSGVVLDPSGAPAAGARMRVVRRPEPGPWNSPVLYDESVEDSGRADETGAFRITGLTPGTVRLTASRRGDAPSPPLEVDVAAATERSGIVLRLETGARVTGEVVDATGRPLSGVSVTVAERHGLPGYHEYHGTDQEGRFEFDGLPAGPIDVMAETDDGLHLEESLVLTAGETAHVRLSSPPTRLRLRGRVTALDQPLPEARIQLSVGGGASMSDTETDVEGKYEVAIPGPGRYRMSVFPSNHSFYWMTEFEVPSVDTFVHDLRIPLGWISGRVTDARGAPVSIAVRSSREPTGGLEEDDLGGGSAQTDSEGRYELLAPAGRIAVSAGGVRSFSRDAKPYTEARVFIDLADRGELHGVDLILVEGGTLECRVSGIPQGERALILEGRDHDEQMLGACDESGLSRFAGLARGPHEIEAISRGRATREPVLVEIVAGETRTIELELVPVVPVEFSVRDARGDLVESEITAVDERGRSRPLRHGQPLPSGHYVLRAQHQGKTAERELEIRGDEENIEVELVLP